MSEARNTEANRDFVFPPLQAEDDNGSMNTEFSVMVPFKVTPGRWGVLMDSLKHWAEEQGLADFVDPEQITVVVMHLPKEES